MSFDKLGLSPELLRAVATVGYSEPTPIQREAIPAAIEGRDVLGIAQTGTGKTASFTLPIIERLAQGRAKARMPRSLILEPTRELAAQVAESLRTYGQNHKLTTALIIGGVSFNEQDQRLARGVDVLIATPGRLLDHVERGKVLLSGIHILVLDECDRMLDMGFIPDVERICRLLPFTRQTLLFSATMSPEIRRLSESLSHGLHKIEVSPPASTVHTVEQYLAKVPSDSKQKRQALRQLLQHEDVKNAIIFCNRKRDVKIVSNSLIRHGFGTAPLHGDLDQSIRMQTLDRFRSGEIKFLVASDVAARGLDIPDVSHIFNYDVPTHAEDYVHRIGRTARAGRKGCAYLMSTPTEAKYLAAIEKLIGKSLSDTEDLDLDDRQDDAGRKHRSSYNSTSRDPKSPSVKRRQAPKKGRPEKKQKRSLHTDGVVGLGDHTPAFLLK